MLSYEGGYFNAKFIHKPNISDSYFFPVYRCLNAETRDFSRVFRFGNIPRRSRRFHNGHRNRVIGILFGGRAKR